MKKDNTFYELDRFMERMEFLNINLKLAGNYPWIYLESVNGNSITREDYTDNHGCTMGWYPIKAGQKFRFNDLPNVFKIIRKYRNI